MDGRGGPARLDLLGDGDGRVDGDGVAITGGGGEGGFDEAAVSIPTTLPALLTRGPPESPGWTLAFTSMSPVSCSELPPLSSLAVMAWLSVVTVPGATLGVPPRRRRCRWPRRTHPPPLSTSHRW